MFSQLFNFKDELCINYSFLVLNFKLRESAEKKHPCFSLRSSFYSNRHPWRKKKPDAQIPNL